MSERSTEQIRELIDSLYRVDSGRILATLICLLGDLAEGGERIRGAFKELTAELARINRLERIDDLQALKEQVEVATEEFVKQYQTFRKTRYARGFKSWAPLYIGGLLTMASALVAPPVAVGIAGASLGIQVIQKKLESPSDQPGRERVPARLFGAQNGVKRRACIGGNQRLQFS